MLCSVLLYKRYKKLRQNEPGFRYAAMSDSVFPSNIHDPSHYSPSPEAGDVTVNTSPYSAAALPHNRPTVNNGYDNGAYSSVINDKPMPIGTSLGQGFATAGNFQSPPEYSGDCVDIGLYSSTIVTHSHVKSRINTNKAYICTLTFGRKTA
jgi:hypothetical protein